MKLHEFPRHQLTFGPSPVHPLKRLTQHLGGAEIWAKREDVNSGLAFGGNKTRKLEYIVPDALAQGADTLVSIGGYQSNHTRQVAAVAAHLGLKCRLVQEKWVDWDDPVNDKVGNILLSRIMGADSRLDPAGFDIGIRSSWEEAMQEVRDRISAVQSGFPRDVKQPTIARFNNDNSQPLVNMALVSKTRSGRELSIIGDMQVAGMPLLAAYTSFKGGHALNNKLLRALLADESAYEVVSFDDERAAPKGFAELAPAW